ncbi:headcase protein isoform X2 [Anopheles moucheti]|uniref:headcase protein isoform X2 n=1 Tax=Anopheles moucheti TaxID=186751 RepID=UPI0022F0EAD4|nr:headcase protein isoform X2 [Anopheles moucheti]
MINLEDLRECVRVQCSNESCTAGQYMHRECFDRWEDEVMAFLKSTARARSWSDKQRQQYLWTKKGYELVHKMCACKCGRGNLKKDLDWNAPTTATIAKKQKKKKNRAAIGMTSASATARMRANSLSSISNGSCTPPASSIGGSEQSISPIHNQAPSPASIAKLPLTPKSKVELHSERVRATSGANGIFSRRLDFSSFNVLPRQRINSYSIKIEDEGNHGNDETRLFILSSLAAQHKSRVACVLCEEPMLVFDRYPLVDGTFFLSPKQHNKGCIEVKYENRVQYLTSVCMACLEGVEPNRVVRCRFCVNKWDGSSLVLGTMYSYDIFAAMPCCTERLKCNNCFKMMLSPNQRLNFYSDYSHSVSCPYCSAQDNHFVKPLSYCYTKQPMQFFQHWP